MWMGCRGSVTTSAPHPGGMNFLPFLGHNFWGLSKGGLHSCWFSTPQASGSEHLSLESPWIRLGPSGPHIFTSSCSLER